ncbi:hypothetical protein HYPSUDRAFT_47449 [Hypholoma sublateritium FD-334 SS-4]|uniref:F-box domain-containing protein n=1 Tax=Hypholoma sublateritium (strain FD-334 SS-4) TaxID=945553 RepID=A0A0D2P7I7_HYPSF|nr:hypothetical protein HYPSUDRAFT_47449 [Hypholoma sublateritium FD-334 SS-4]
MAMLISKLQTLASTAAYDLFSTNRVPTEKERENLEEYLTEIDLAIKVNRMRVSQNELEIKKLQEENERLRTEEIHMVESEMQHRRVLSPFRRVPDDIVREILVACMDPTTVSTMDRATTPLMFTLVSSNFRQVALTTPQLWDSLHVEFNQYLPHLRKTEAPPPMRRYSQLVREWLLRRSGAMPLRIRIKVNCVFRGEYGLCDGLVNDIAAIILACASRWRDIEFITTPFSRLSKLKATDVPCLRSLTLHNKNSVLLPSMKFLRAPNLSRLIVCRDRTSPGHFAINWRKITHLSLDGTLWGYRLNDTFDKIVHILRQAVNLKECSLRMSSTQIGATHSTMTFSLPFLKSFKIHLDQYQRPYIIQCIHAPILENLYLSNYAAPLTTFFEQSPYLQTLHVGLASITELMAALRHCFSLKTLHITHIGTEIAEDHEAFLRAFINEDEAAQICPLLECFSCSQTLDVSIDTVRAFLNRRDRKTPSLICWRAIAMDALEESTDRYIANVIAKHGLNKDDGWN